MICCYCYYWICLFSLCNFHEIGIASPRTAQFTRISSSVLCFLPFIPLPRTLCLQLWFFMKLFCIKLYNHEHPNDMLLLLLNQAAPLAQFLWNRSSQPNLPRSAAAVFCIFFHLLFAFCFSFYETFCVKLHNQWHPNDMPLLLLLLLLNLPARLAQFPWNIMQTSVCWLRLHIRAGGFDGPKIFENLSFVEILLAFSP